MIIDKNISKYIIYVEDTIINALKKISDNKNRIVFAVSEYGQLEGVLTDGDFRRWLVEQDNIDLNQSISKLINKNFRFANVEDTPEKIQSYFSKRIQHIPIIDSKKHLIAVASADIAEIQIGKFIIGEDSPVFIIAEIGNNHNGDINLAKRLVDEAIKAGADCVKFQMRDLESLYHNAGNPNDVSEDLGAQYTLDLLSKFQLSKEEMREVFDYCKEQGILPLCTPWDVESLVFLESYGMEAYKLASADLTNNELLIKVAKTGKPMLVSTGMATEKEITEAVQLLERQGAQYVLLHCNSTYPAPFKDINLRYIDRLKEIGKCPVGYSGHERGIYVSIAAVARGAKVIEKHFTLDKTMEGNDHKVSLLPDEFRAMVEGIREIEQAMGKDTPRYITQGEMMNRETLAKSLVITCDLEVGQVITEDMIAIKSPGRGLQPNRKAELVGLRAKRDFKKGDFFYLTDLMVDSVKARNYIFSRPWGIPVRYHDFHSILRKTNPDLLEFHLSYKDLDEDISKFFDRKYELGFVVHTPELFAGDHLLDLCSLDENYRRRSVAELQRVVDITRELKRYFTKTARPLIVTNMGGFTKNEPMLPEQRKKYYDLILQSLSEVDFEGVEIIPQTMPPFPWHFGGQRYQNLFMDPEDIVTFCRENGYRVCLDVSHSKLACNHHKWSFKEFVEKVGPYTAHLHIVDAQGVDGEGLQIGEGDIDFPALAQWLREYAPKASFIPEIWQGHKNDGEGFWIALEKLEKWF